MFILVGFAAVFGSIIARHGKYPSFPVVRSVRTPLYIEGRRPTLAAGTPDHFSSDARGDETHRSPLAASGRPFLLAGMTAGPAVLKRESIVLVEDDKPLRHVIRIALERSGYEVHPAASEDEALALFALHHVDLLLTDVMLRDGDGVEFANRLLAERPKVTVLFMSGHSNDSRLVDSAGVRQSNFLAKPFTPGKLVDKVRELLDAADPSS